MRSLHYIKKTLFCISACVLMAACNGQNGHATPSDTDADNAAIAVSDADTVSTITVIDIIE